MFWIIMYRFGNVFSPVLLDLIETAEQFSMGEVILHVTGRLNWESELRFWACSSKNLLLDKLLGLSCLLFQ